MTDNSNQGVQRAIRALGGVHYLAKACGVSVQAVYKWRLAGVTAERAIQIEEATGGAVKRHELRPDLYPGSRDVHLDGPPGANAAPMVGFDGIARAIDAAGGIKAMAEACDATPLEVNNWRFLGVPELKLPLFLAAANLSVDAGEIPIQKAQVEAAA